jgi:hypothetical protein
MACSTALISLAVIGLDQRSLHLVTSAIRHDAGQRQ